MATSKLIKPTNVTVQIPAFTDQPDNRVNSNCIDKAIDGINALSDQIGSLYTAKSYSVSVSANSDATIEINSAETGYTYGVLVGIYASVAWGSCSIVAVVAQNTLYPNRIKVHSTQAQTVSATILWFK